MFKTVGACLLSLAPSLASASQANGPDFDPDRIRTFQVAGVHLGMSADEAAAVLKDAGYEGRFPKFAGTERNASVWVQVDQKAAPFRYEAKDGKVRVFEMIFEQHFDRPQSLQALKDMVTAKYGEPTEVTLGPNEGALTYHAHYTLDHGTYRASCAGGTSPLCSNTQLSTLESESDLPVLALTITPTLLRADIRDFAAPKEGEAASKAAADAARENKALANSAKTKLGL